MLLAVLLCLSVQSCDLGRAEAVPSPDDAVRVTLRISAGEETSLTRSVVEESQPGESFENYIDVNNVHILFFDKSTNLFIEEFKPESITPVDDSSYPQVWELNGPIENPLSGAFKVVVLANWPGEVSLSSGVTSIEDLCKADWSMCADIAGSSGFWPSETSAIPMYGVKTVDSFVLRKDIINNLGEIDLLRSVSKIVVSVDPDVTQTLESVTLVRSNKSLACAPLGMYGNTHNLPYGNSVHLYKEAGDNETDAGRLAFRKSSDRDEWTAYVPEYRNVDPETGGTRSDCTSVEVRFRGIDKTYTLDFRDYSAVADDGKRFNIVRNHLYDFTIKSIGAYDASVTLIAQPWETSEFEIDYNKTVGVSKMIEWTDTNHVQIVDSKVVASTAGDLVCEFTIASPVGATWHAVFEERSGDINHFKFDGGTNVFADGTDYISGIVDGNLVKLTIMQNPETVGTAMVVIYASYGNVNFNTSLALGGPYMIIKDY